MATIRAMLLRRVGDEDEMKPEMVPGLAMMPYFLSAALASPWPKNATGWLFLSWMGLFLHIATWITVVTIDIYLAVSKFNDAGGSGMMLHMLQIAALSTVTIAAGVVVAFTALHLLRFNFNQTLLPPFASSAITASIKATLEFSKFLLLFAVFEPVAAVQGANSVSLGVRQLLVAQVVLKQYGVSLTMNQHRRRVFGETLGADMSHH